MNPKIRQMMIGLFALALLAVSPVTASTFVAMDQQELIASSGTVIEGRVLSTHSFWNEAGTAILTEAKIEVGDVIAGDAPAIVVVRTFGGQVGNYAIEALGFPKFEQGEEVLLFLNREKADNSLRVTGYQLGHYEIRPDDTGVATAFPTLEHDVQLLFPDGRKHERPAALPLETLKTQIRERAARPTAIVR